MQEKQLRQEQFDLSSMHRHWRLQHHRASSREAAFQIPEFASRMETEAVSWNNQAIHMACICSQNRPVVQNLVDLHRPD